MTKQLETSIVAGLAWHATSDDEPRYAYDRNQIVGEYEFVSGDLAGQADCVLYRQLIVEEGATVDISLTGGETDSFGDAFSIDTLKMLAIINRNTESGEILTVGGSVDSVDVFANASDAVLVGPGGAFVVVAPSLTGYTVSQGTSDILRLSAAGADITVDVAVVGVFGGGGGVMPEMALVNEGGDYIVTELGDTIEVGI